MRYAHLLQPLNQLRLLTRGNPLGLRDLLARIRPDLDISTLVVEGGAPPPAFAQLRRYRTDSTAYINFALVSPMQIAQKMPVLLDQMAKIAGSWQALAILADLPADSELLPCMRRGNFLVWAEQIVFQFKAEEAKDNNKQWQWRFWHSEDLLSMQTLYRRLVPVQHQAIEPLTRKRMQGLLLHDPSGQLLAYADLDQGQKGIWVQLFALPELRDPQALLAIYEALNKNYELLGRPVYLACRSYQPWLAELARQAGFVELPEQVLLVRYLVRHARDEMYETIKEGAPVQARIGVAQLSHESAKKKSKKMPG